MPSIKLGHTRVKPDLVLSGLAEVLLGAIILNKVNNKWLRPVIRLGHPFLLHYKNLNDDIYDRK